MAAKRPSLINGEIYHVVVRGVGDTEIFRNNDDYYRGIFSLYEFNDINTVLIKDRRRARIAAKKTGNNEFSAPRELLVEILAFCFMSNHVHVLLRQIQNNGITTFMRKFGTGYAGYFNRKYKRMGHLFQGKFRAVHVQTDEQLKVVFAYIHTNPISFAQPGWKEDGVKNPRKTCTFLEEEYRWSSYFDYLGRKNFPSITERESLLRLFGGKKNAKYFVRNWIQCKAQNYTDKVNIE